MDGLSFSDFENSSFDSLYNRGFAGAKEFDRHAKNLKPGDYAMHLENGRPAFAMAAPAQARQLRDPSPAHLTRAPRPALADSRARGQQRNSSHRAQHALTNSAVPTSIPLNDMGAMPGSRRVDHTWMPSREADAQARNAGFQLPASQPAAATIKPEGGGQRGAFLNWKSN
mmetsp:Transcript_127159/g.220466  ORF Transcript_127159/g.220466 Transcript_127159/m.220466 type:complete len:170 (+) Transcript_127159:86-595(+)